VHMEALKKKFEQSEKSKNILKAQSVGKEFKITVGDIEYVVHTGEKAFENLNYYTMDDAGLPKEKKTANITNFVEGVYVSLESIIDTKVPKG